MKIPPRRLLAETLGTLAILASVATATLVFVWPWRERLSPGGPSLARYAPHRDGEAALYAELGPDGAARGWDSRNVAVVGTGRAGVFTLRGAMALAIADRYGASMRANVLDELRARLVDVEIAETRQRTLAADGEIRESVTTAVRDASGDAIVGIYDSTEDRDIVFTPPLRVLPADLRVGDAWEGEGQVGGQVAYRIEGRVIEAGAGGAGAAGARGSDAVAGGPDSDGSDDCVLVRSRLVFSQGGQVARDTTRDERYCAGVGLVEAREFDADGAPERHVTLVTASGPMSGARPIPAGAVHPTAAPVGPPDRWAVTPLGRSSTAGAVASTVPPLWVPTQPALVLTAGYGGDLVAFDADDPTGTIAWRFHPGGTIYGPFAFDPDGGRIFFGATDKRLYALDARGLFLWSFEAGDNVATRPLVAGDVVIAGSEDGTVYGLDSATGTPRWRAGTGGPVVSSPALAGEGTTGTVVVGADDGTVYGFDLVDGGERWRYQIGGAVEASVVVADGRAYAASHSGAVVALDPTDGAPLWRSSVASSRQAASILPAVRTAPVIGLELVVIADQFGTLVALDRDDGRLRWTVPDPGFVGPPLVIDDGIVVLGKDGGVYRFDRDGRLDGHWPTTTGAPASATGTSPGFDVGPTVGGGAIWLADSAAAVKRLGPAPAGPPILSAAWLASTLSPPFDRNVVTLAVSEYAGKAVVLDGGKGISLLDPSTGAGARVGRLDAPGTLAPVDPVADDNVLIALVGDALHAVRLPDARPLWSARGAGRSYRPPSVGEGAVAWLSQPTDASAGNTPVTIQVVERATGEARWRTDLEGVSVAGGAVIDAGTVYVSTPPSAFDLGSGAVRWRADAGGPTVGGPALDRTGGTMFVVAADGPNAVVLALATTDGRPRWRAVLGRLAPSIREAPWVSGDTVILAFFSGEIIGLDAASGAERWRFRPPTTRHGAITVDDGRVWFALETGQVVGLDAASGAVVARSRRLDETYAGGTLGAHPTRVGNVTIVPFGTVVLGVAIP